MKGVLKKIIELTGYSLVNTKILRNPQKQKPVTRDDFFNVYFSRIDPSTFFFVQIGANDGKSSDPIYPYVTKYNLAGVAVEPQPAVFERLAENYKEYPKVTCINAAIGSVSGPTPFYTVKKSAQTTDNWFPMTRIASFNKESIKRGLRKKIPFGTNPEDYIEETSLQALSFPDFLQQYRIDRVDFLQVDCEGYDYEILRKVDLRKLAPQIINCETCLFSDDERAEYEARLTELGYLFFRYGDDTCAYKI